MAAPDFCGEKIGECNKLVSEVLPDELPESIDADDYDFFVQHFMFLPPDVQPLDLEKATDTTVVLGYGDRSAADSMIEKSFFEALGLSVSNIDGINDLEGRKVCLISSFSSHPPTNHALGRLAKDLVIFREDGGSPVRYWMEGRKEPVKILEGTLRSRFGKLQFELGKSEQSSNPAPLSLGIRELYLYAGDEEGLHAGLRSRYRVWLKVSQYGPPCFKAEASRKILGVIFSGNSSREKERLLRELIRTDEELPSRFSSLLMKDKLGSERLASIERLLSGVDQLFYEPALSFVHFIEHHREAAADMVLRIFRFLSVVEEEVGEPFNKVRMLYFKYALYGDSTEAELIKILRPSMSQFTNLEVLSLCIWAVLGDRMSCARTIYETRVQQIPFVDDTVNPLWVFCTVALAEEGAKGKLCKVLSTLSSQQNRRSPMHVLQGLLYLVSILGCKELLDSALSSFSNFGRERSDQMSELLKEIPPIDLSSNLNTVLESWVRREIAEIDQESTSRIVSS